MMRRIESKLYWGMLIAIVTVASASDSTLSPKEQKAIEIEDKYSQEHMMLIYEMLVFKELCDNMLPGFMSRTYAESTRWEDENSELIEFFRKSDHYKNAIATIHSNSNAQPKGEQLRSLCIGLENHYRGELN